MKKHSIHIFLLLMRIVFCTSCMNELPFKNANSKSKIIMNAFINSDSINHILYLNYTGKQSYTDVTDANVEVTVNDVVVAQGIVLPPEEDQVYYNGNQMKILIDYKFNPGDKVRIDAITDDGQHAWIEEIVPLPPLPIENIDTVRAYTRYGDNYYGELLRFDITIKDKSEEKNYYRLILERQSKNDFEIDEDDNYNHISSGITGYFKIYNHEDIVLTDGNPTLGGDEYDDKPKNIYSVFDDSRFSGTNHTLKVYKDIDYTSGENLFEYRCYVRLQSINKQTYRHYQYLNLMDSYAYDPMFSEPVIQESNVNGGTGMVCFSSETSVLMELPIRESNN